MAGLQDLIIQGDKKKKNKKKDQEVECINKKIYLHSKVSHYNAIFRSPLDDVTTTSIQNLLNLSNYAIFGIDLH